MLCTVLRTWQLQSGFVDELLLTMMIYFLWPDCRGPQILCMLRKYAVGSSSALTDRLTDCIADMVVSSFSLPAAACS